MIQQESDTTEILLSGGNPVSGMSSTLDASALGSGLCQLLENLRVTKILPEVRGGTEVIYAAPIGSATYRGSLVSDVFGVVVAVDVSSAVRVYRYSGGSWSEITTVGTRMTTGNDVTFIVVEEPPVSSGLAPWNVSGTRFLVAQNGVNDPLVMAEGGSSMTAHTALTTGEPSRYRAVLDYEYFYRIGKEDSGRTPNGITNITDSDATKLDGDRLNTGTTEQVLTLAVKAVAGGYDATTLVDFTEAIPWASAKWMHVLFQATSGEFLPYEKHPNVWDNFKIEVYDGTTSATIFDPTSSTYPRPVIAENLSGNYLAAFLVPSTLAVNSYDKVRFTYKGGEPESELTLSIYAIMASMGDVPGGTSFAISHFTTNSRAESASVVCTNEDAVNAKSFGAPLIDGMEIPVSPAIGYAYRIIDPASGGDYRCVYTAAPGQDEFYFSTSNAVASTMTVTSAVQYPIVAPGGLHQPMPKASVASAVGARVLLSGGSAKGLWFSALSFPFRFRPTLEYLDGNPVLGGAGTVVFQGETVAAIEPLAGAFASNESALVWTAQALYRLDGSDSFQLSRPRKVAPFGTLSPKSVAMHNGSAFWLDSERQVRSYGATFESPSMQLIESDLAAIPDSRIGNVVGTVHKDAYYLGLTMSGGSTNLYVFVWDMRVRGWSRFTVPTGISGGAVRLQTGTFSGSRKLCAWSNTGAIYEYDKPGVTDLGSDIAITFTTKEYTAGYFDSILMKRVGVACSTGSGNLTLTRLTRAGTATPTATLVQLSSTTVRDGGGGIVWRYDETSGGVQGGHSPDWAVALRLTGTVGTGWKLLAMRADLSTRIGGADV